MTFRESEALSTAMISASTKINGRHVVEFSMVLQVIQSQCPAYGFKFVKDGNSELFSVDRSEMLAKEAHDAELLCIERQVELAKKRLDAELEIQKYREKLEEIRATAERASKAPPGSLTFVPKPGDSDRRSP